MIDVNNLKFITIDKETCNGRPILKGTRFTIAQLLSEIVEEGSIQPVVDAFDLDRKLVENALLELALFIDPKGTKGVR